MEIATNYLVLLPNAEIFSHFLRNHWLKRQWCRNLLHRKQSFRFLLIFQLLLFFSFVYIPITFAESFEETKQKCGMCHGQDGNSPSSTIPSIAGITTEFFIHTMDAYKNNGRKSDMMKSFVHSLTEEDINKLANYYGNQKFLPRNQEFNTEFAKQGKLLHDKYCEKCHENAGRITENNYGILAGQWMPYLRQAIKDYLDNKRRVNPMMIKKLEKLKNNNGEDGIEKVIHYYGSLQ